MNDSIYSFKVRVPFSEILSTVHAKYFGRNMVSSFYFIVTSIATDNVLFWNAASNYLQFLIYGTKGYL
jgi:hypothetical protein